MQGARRRPWWIPRASRATPQTPLALPTLRDRADFPSSIVVASLLGIDPTASAPPRLRGNLARSRSREILTQAPKPGLFHYRTKPCERHGFGFQRIFQLPPNVSVFVRFRRTGMSISLIHPKVLGPVEEPPVIDRIPHFRAGTCRRVGNVHHMGRHRVRDDWIAYRRAAGIPDLQRVDHLVAGHHPI